MIASASCVLLFLFGLVTAVLAFTPFAPVALPGGTRPLLLGTTLLVHCVPSAALAFVLIARRGVCMLQPTAWALRSRTPAILTASITLCLAVGGSLLVWWGTQRSSTSRVDAIGSAEEGPAVTGNDLDETVEAEGAGSLTVSLQQSLPSNPLPCAC